MNIYPIDPTDFPHDVVICNVADPSICYVYAPSMGIDIAIESDHGDGKWRISSLSPITALETLIYKDLAGNSATPCEWQLLSGDRNDIRDKYKLMCNAAEVYKTLTHKDPRATEIKQVYVTMGQDDIDHIKQTDDIVVFAKIRGPYLVANYEEKGRIYVINIPATDVTYINLVANLSPVIGSDWYMKDDTKFGVEILEEVLNIKNWGKNLASILENLPYAF